MKTLRQLIAETRLPTAKGELDFYKAHVDNIEIVTDPQNDDDAHKAKKIKTYTGKDPKGGRVAEATDPKDARRGKMLNHHPKEPVKAETPIKEEVELLSEDEMARRGYVYERIFTLIDDISEIVDEFYTEEKDYENAINARTKEYRKNPDKDPKIPYPEYPTRPWSIANVARTLDELYQELLGNTNRDVDHVYEDVELTEMKKPDLFRKLNKEPSVDTKADKAGVHDAHGGDTSDYADDDGGDAVTEENLSEISKKTLKSYIKKAHANFEKHAGKADNARAHARDSWTSDDKDYFKGVQKTHDRIADKREAGIKLARSKVKKLKEDVEQIDELSRKTLGSYVKKASADSAHALIKHGETKKDALSPHSAKIVKKLHNDNIRKINKRQKGIGQATDRLVREDAEQIDELSKKTLGSYVKKANDSYDKHAGASNNAWNRERSSGPEDRAEAKKSRIKHDQIADRREAGIERAHKKLKEDTQLDELSNETKANYVQKALADRTTADKEARMNISGAKKVGVADPKEGRRLLAIAKAASARRDKRATGISRAKKDDA